MYFRVGSLLASLSMLATAWLTPSEYDVVRKEIKALVDDKNCAPILVRLAWHDAGTYDKQSRTGGPHAAMRFAEGETQYGANAGLGIARELLQPIVDKYSTKVSVTDLWVLAGTVAIQHTGGPPINFRFGRSDTKSAEESATEGRLPDDDKPKQTNTKNLFFFTQKNVKIRNSCWKSGVN